MNDALVMGVVERFGGRCAEVKRAFGSEEFLGVREVLQRDARHVLHRNIGEALVLTGIENGDDIRMGKTPGAFSLAIETQPRLLEFLVFEFFLDRNCLESNRTVNARILCKVNRAHRTAADPAFDNVASETLGTDASRHFAGFLAGRRTVRALHPFEDRFCPFGLGLFFECQ